jgi:uncharacterized membrane protein
VNGAAPILATSSAEPAVAASGPAPRVEPARRRIASVDVLRGLAMVVMVLDHTRDFAHAESFRFDPTDIDQTSPDIFLTRWITHFVAPIFVLLAGTSARLQVEAGRSRRSIARFLVLRGLWLVVLEFTVVRIGIWFNLDPTFLGMLQVIWVLGISMVVLAALVFLPDILIAGFGLALVVGHNALDGIRAAPDLQLAWSILHERANVEVFSSQRTDLFILYPLIPWVGVVALGYVLGRAYRSSSTAAGRRRLLVLVGLATTAAWIGIRAVNDYGDPRPWQASPDTLTTILSFLNAEKYPPSLDFLAMTLGPALMLLGLLDGVRADRAPLRWLATLGAVPLFFYLLQWYVAHGLSLLAEWVAGQDIAWHFTTPPERFFSIPPDAGFPLPVVYLLWVTAIAILYPVSRWYRGVRARRGGIFTYL